MSQNNDYDFVARPDPDILFGYLEKISSELSSIRSELENITGYIPDMPDHASLDKKFNEILKVLERIERK